MSVSLSTAVAKAKSTTELYALVKKGAAEISFFGNRVITVKGRGSVYIDTVAERILKIVEANFNYSEKERAAGKKLTSLVDRAYKKTGEDSKKLNYISWIFCKIIDWYMKNLQRLGYGIRFFWESTTSDIFDCYTAKQFVEVFGEDGRIGGCVMEGCYPNLYYPAKGSEKGECSPRELREIQAREKTPKVTVPGFSTGLKLPTLKDEYAKYWKE